MCYAALRPQSGSRCRSQAGTPKGSDDSDVDVAKSSVVFYQQVAALTAIFKCVIEKGGIDSPTWSLSKLLPTFFRYLLPQKQSPVFIIIIVIVVMIISISDLLPAICVCASVKTHRRGCLLCAISRLLDILFIGAEPGLFCNYETIIKFLG